MFAAAVAALQSDDRSSACDCRDDTRLGVFWSMNEFVWTRSLVFFDCACSIPFLPFLANLSAVPFGFCRFDVYEVTNSGYIRSNNFPKLQLIAYPLDGVLVTLNTLSSFRRRLLEPCNLDP